jgi:hypothetical protein
MTPVSDTISTPDTKSPKQILLEQLDPFAPGIVTEMRQEGASWDDIAARINTRLAPKGVNVRVSRESLRQWYSPAEARAS